MFKWAWLLLAAFATGACLLGLGVGERAMGLLVLAIFVMVVVAFLISRPFLNKPPTQ